jgi:hypothetical protein
MLGGLFEVEQASLRLEILTARRIGAWNHPEQRKRSPKHEAAQISARTKVALAAARAKALGGWRPRRADQSAACLGRQDAVRLRRGVPHGRRQDRRVVDHMGQLAASGESSRRSRIRRLHLSG